MHRKSCEAQWLAYAFPCRRFAVTLADDRARLRVDADRYSFIVSDLHRLLLAGFSGALRKICTLSIRIITELAASAGGTSGPLLVASASSMRSLSSEAPIVPVGQS